MYPICFVHYLSFIREIWPIGSSSPHSRSIKYESFQVENYVHYVEKKISWRVLSIVRGKRKRKRVLYRCMVF